MKCDIFKILFALLLISYSPYVTAQQDTTTNRTKSDSTTLKSKNKSKSLENETRLMNDTDAAQTTVENIKKKSKRGFARFLSRIFFRNKKRKFFGKTVNEEIASKVSPFEKYNGKVIRKIDISSLKPFQSSIYDSVFTRRHKKITKLGRFADNLHTPTVQQILRYNLLFKPDSKLNARIMDENLALLRNMSNIYDAQFIVTEVSPDTVDIRLVSRDVVAFDFSINRLDDRKGELGISNQNLFGFGSNISASLMYNTSHKPYIGYRIRHKINNIFGTFIRTDLHIQDVYNKKRRIFTIERQLVPSVSNIFGANYSYNDLPRYFITVDSSRNFIDESMSAWVGKAFYVDKMKTTRFVAQLKYMRQNFVNRNEFPNIDQHIYYPYEKNEQILLQLSLFRQRFLSNRFIYSYGATESTPVGYNASLTLGYENHRYFNRLYTAAGFNYGVQLKNGYHYYTAQLGSFFNHGKPEQGTLKITGNYFSNLFKIGKLRMRKYFNANLTVGLHRLNGEGDYLFYEKTSTIEVDNAKLGYEGTKRLFFSSQTGFFTNINLWGSRIVLYDFFDAGFLGKKKDIFANPFYYGFGIGVRLGNEFFIFRSIDIKLGWYPKLPQEEISRYYDFSHIEKFVSRDFTPQAPEIIPFE